MAPPATVMMTVKAAKGPPTLADAAHQLGIAVSDVSATFGVVPVNAEEGLYCVEVRAESVATRAPETPYDGPFSNPRIEPFGPLQPESADPTGPRDRAADPKKAK